MVDFEKRVVNLLQAEKVENQSPWYSGAFFMRNSRSECMVVAEEKKRTIKSFSINLGSY